MRIAMWHNLPSGGAKRALHEQVKGLLSRGHHLEAWCPPVSDTTFLPLSTLIDEHVVSLDEQVSPPWASGGRWATLRSSAPMRRVISDHAARCAAQMRDGDFDVYLATTCQYFGSPPIARYLPSPNVLFLQEPHRWLYEANPDFPWLAAETQARNWQDVPRKLLEAGRIYRRSERARFEVDNARSFDAILVNSYFSRETVLRVYGLDAVVCSLGVDTSLFRPTGAAHEDVVLGVGTLAPHKNAALLVDAVARMDPPRPRVEWVGASRDEPYAAEVRRSASRQGVDMHLELDADDATLVQSLNRAKLLVYASHLEPFGLVPLEASACELPVVAVPEAGIRETVIDGVNGLLVGATSAEVARAIRWLLDDAGLRQRLGRQGREHVERAWTLEQATDRLEELLTALAARRELRPV